MFSAAQPLAGHVLSAVRFVDEVPEDNEVKAGTVGLIVLLCLVLAVVVICVSMFRRLRNAERAQERGVYGDPVTTPGSSVDGPGSAEERRPEGSTDDRPSDSGSSDSGSADSGSSDSGGGSSSD